MDLYSKLLLWFNGVEIACDWKSSFRYGEALFELTVFIWDSMLKDILLGEDEFFKSFWFFNERFGFLTQKTIKNIFNLYMISIVSYARYSSHHDLDYNMNSRTSPSFLPDPLMVDNQDKLSHRASACIARISQENLMEILCFEFNRKIQPVFWLIFARFPLSFWMYFLLKNVII